MSKEEELSDNEMIILSIDPGITNMGWVLAFVRANIITAKCEIEVIDHGTWCLDRFKTGYRKDEDFEQIVDDIQSFFRLNIIQHLILLNKARYINTYLLVENQYMGFGKIEKIGLVLKVIQNCVATAFQTVVQMIGYNALLYYMNPRSVNSIMNIKGSKKEDPKFKLKFFQQNFDFKYKITEHEADCFLQLCAFIKDSLISKNIVVFSIVKKTTENENDAEKINFKRNEQQGAQAKEIRFDARPNSGSVESEVSLLSSSGYFKADEDRISLAASTGIEES